MITSITLYEGSDPENFDRTVNYSYVGDNVVLCSYYHKSLGGSNCPEYFDSVTDAIEYIVRRVVSRLDHGWKMAPPAGLTAEGR